MHLKCDFNTQGSLKVQVLEVLFSLHSSKTNIKQPTTSNKIEKKVILET